MGASLLRVMPTGLFSHGELPLCGARVTIAPDGATAPARGGWSVTL
ncbi:hypothetical protein STRIP9103_02784 [Streptomyces ipomoeae 91-03]|uniref:Uncharacterized protein n=1 Tax=Streptomyces ipomoeae 91-03 TaxID=698759 RepID=L1L8G6_9ACTN|nr:hypothetical protein STRIP9103_02784 [Streptomyces ipomoeae 91-03]